MYNSFLVDENKIVKRGVRQLNILVTGGAGYVGSQLIRDLGEHPELAGSRIIIFDNMQDERYQSLMNLPPSGIYDFVYGDVQNLDDLVDAVQGCDVVIHLAALTNAVVSFERIPETERTNFQGTKNVVEAVKRSSTVRRVIYASTCSVYGETTGIVNEESECHPESPYGVYKLMGEQEVLALPSQTNGRISGTALRLATVFGLSPGLRVHTVVNKFAIYGALGMPITVHGTGEQKRPFIHVKDASSAFIFALLNPATENGVFNVVGENASVNQVLSYVRPRFPRLKVERKEGRHLNQISYEVDGSKFRALGWKPTISVEDGVEEFAKLCSGINSGIYAMVK